MSTTRPANQPPGYNVAVDSGLTNGTVQQPASPPAVSNHTRPGAVVLSWKPSPEDLSQVQAHVPLGAPPGYNTIRLPPNPVRYSFSPLSFNSMLLIPEADSPDSRPLYHISVNLNCFNPSSYITTIRSGATENSKRIANFEVGISSEDATVVMRGTEHQLGDVLIKTKGSHLTGIWSWKFPGTQKLVWNCKTEPRFCHLPSDSAKRLAEFYPASYLKKTNPFAQSQIVVYPEGQALLDDILVTSLIIERLRLIPSGSEGKALFSYRQQVDTNLI